MTQRETESWRSPSRRLAPTKERLREFHDKLLNAGQVPLYLIRREIMPENALWDGKMWDTSPTG